MKNIEVMKNITAMQKTAIAKITAKITTTALLFFLALFTLTTCLVAQESGQTRKQGWFVGVSPYFLGAESQNYHSFQHHRRCHLHKHPIQHLSYCSIVIASLLKPDYHHRY